MTSGTAPSRRGADLLAGVFLCGAVLLLAPAQADAAAWTLDNGKGLVILKSTFDASNQTFDSSGSLQSSASYRKFELEALIEYGFTDWATGFLKPTFESVNVGEPTPGNHTGLGYSSAGLRTRLYNSDDRVLSVQAELLGPGASDQNNPAEIGNTGWNFDLRMLGVQEFSLWSIPSYLNLEAGYRWRAGGPPNEFRFDTAFGLRPTERLLLLAQTFTVIGDGTASNGYSWLTYTKLQPSIVYDLNDAWSLQFGGYSTITGRNAMQENALFAAVWRRF